MTDDKIKAELEGKISFDFIMDLFKEYRFNDNTHLGLGDIRLSMGAQEEIAKAIAGEANHPKGGRGK